MTIAAIDDDDGTYCFYYYLYNRNHKTNIAYYIHTYKYNIVRTILMSNLIYARWNIKIYVSGIWIHSFNYD